MNIIEYENYQETKPHADSLFPYNTYLCSIPLDFNEVPLHWHNEMEIIYIKKGRGNVTLDFDNHYVEYGDIIIVLPGQMHGISRLGDYTMEYENIIFAPEMLMSVTQDTLSEEFFTPFMSGKITFNHIISKDSPNYNNISGCLNRADKIGENFPRGYKLAIKGALYEFFYELYQVCSLEAPDKSNKNIDRIKDIVKYIETNYDKPISIAGIAGVAGFSESHFMKFFKTIMGTSFVDYLNDYRLSMASRMLVSSDDKIIDIAAHCGYDNLSYFNRIFKKKYGITPSAYRRK